MNVTTHLSTQGQKPFKKPFLKQLRSFDWFCLTAGIGALIYYLCTIPLLVGVAVLIFGVLYPFLGLPFITPKGTTGTLVRSVSIRVPGTSRPLTIKFWHILAIALTLFMLLTLADPSYAFFLNTAQTKMESTICNATQGLGGTGGGTGGGTCNASALVSTIFDVIRIAVVLAVIGGVVAIFVQGQQQQDIRPAVMFVGIVFTAVLITEVVSRWILSP